MEWGVLAQSASLGFGTHPSATVLPPNNVLQAERNLGYRGYTWLLHSLYFPCNVLNKRVEPVTCGNS